MGSGGGLVRLRTINIISYILKYFLQRSQMLHARYREEMLWHDRTKIRDTEDSLVAIILILKILIYMKSESTKIYKSS